MSIFSRRTGTHLTLAVFIFVAASWNCSAARAGSLADVFNSGELAGLELGPIGPALANTVASTYPVASASSSVTYSFNPKTETFERQTGVLGPIVGERAETIGKSQVNLNVSYSSVDLSTINGHDLGRLENQATIDGRVVSFPVPGGLRLCSDATCSYQNARFSNFLPVHVLANIDVEADIVTPSFTYGVTPDLDVNVTLPLLKTFLGVRVVEEVPDARLPQFKVRVCNPNAPAGDPILCHIDPTTGEKEVPPQIPSTAISRSAFARATGFGDLLLRGKYTLLRDKPVDLAASLGVSFPSGDPDNFHGTGTYRVQPSLVLSKAIAERFEPLLNLGVDINADDVDRSVFRWAVGGTAKVWGPLTGAVVFLGRNEFNAQADKITAPFFFQIERNDLYDASFGLRCLFAETGVISVNAIMPLNRDGLRADVIPTVEVEYAFTAPF